MGAGIALPENATKDIVFPDYNQPELDAVRQKWNAASLVVLDKELIKSIKGNWFGMFSTLLFVN